VKGRAEARAARVLADNVEAFARAGYREEGRSGLEARLTAGERPPLRLRMSGDGRVFGGSFGLEIATAEPVLPQTRGLRARARGVVRTSGVSFSAARGDEPGERLAERLEADEQLLRALADVHFERVRVDPDGRAVIRHMGGSVVWLLFPPVARTTPLPAGQPEAMVRALDEFARAGARGLSA
jgi:Protein of unknown function (DUF3156)